VTEHTISRGSLLAAISLLALALPVPPARASTGSGRADSSADPVRAQGTIELDGDTRVEVLSGNVPVGKRIDLPEGWYRVEDEGVEERDVGSFTVASASSDAGAPEPGAATVPPAAPAIAEPVSSPAALAAAMGQAEACRRERSAFLKELWRESGIEVSDPDALVRGLDAGTLGPGAAFVWSALSTDAFRNLAWSSELRSRADELVRCVHAHE
jgi:hypothetical protein